MALRDFNRTMMLPMRVWDAPTRLFHWAIVLLLLTQLHQRASQLDAPAPGCPATPC